MDRSKRYFGLRGGWLTTWITIACGADMTLYGYDQVCLQQGAWLLNSTTKPGSTGRVQRRCYLQRLSTTAQSRRTIEDYAARDDGGNL